MQVANNARAKTPQKRGTNSGLNLFRSTAISGNNNTNEKDDQAKQAKPANTQLDEFVSLVMPNKESAHANIRKLSPALLLGLNCQHNSQYYQPLGNYEDYRSDEQNALMVVRCKEKAKLASCVRQIGGTLQNDQGPSRSVLLPISKALQLADNPDIVRIRLSERLTKSLDKVAQMHKLAPYRSRTNAYGKGVLIGIVDTGIDGKNRAFAGRLDDKCWDQTVNGPGINGYTYGKIVRGERMTDEDGHGTHVSGIAAGNDSEFPGVVPQARILAVKTDFYDSHIQDAVSYIFARGKELEMPTVVNLSLGGHADAHDGTDDLSASIDFELQTPGRAVICAAGNSAEKSIHMMETLDTRESKQIEFRVSAGIRGIRINLWHSGAKKIEIAISNPSGSLTPFHRPPEQKKSIVEKALASFSKCFREPDSSDFIHVLNGDVVSIVTQKDPVNNDYNTLIDINSRHRKSPVQSGNWCVWVRCKKGPVQLHGWILDEASTVSWNKPTSSHLIGCPGACKSAITVGAYASRVKMEGLFDSQRNLENLGYELGRLAPFSSPGPLRNAEKKPDVCAAGTMVVSTRSGAASYGANTPTDATHAVMNGTSMSSPVIAGLAVSILEQHPTWTGNQIKEALISASRSEWSPADGYGIVFSDKLS